jgi:hypothetical protein
MKTKKIGEMKMDFFVSELNGNVITRGRNRNNMWKQKKRRENIMNCFFSSA